MTSATELKPCPFCGGDAEIHPSNDWDVKFLGSTYFVWCDKCETRGDYYNTEAEAIAAWNSRAPIEYDGWFYLPKPKEGIVVYGVPEITRTENGYKVWSSADVVDEAARKWGEELGEYAMRRICEIWNTRAERTCEPTEEDCCPYCGDDLVRCNVGIGELGGAVELDPPIYHNYCPNCGARVKAAKQ